MVIQVQDLIELIMVTLIIKLIVMEWTPPIQRSKQAIFCLVIGSAFGVFLNPTREGAITAILASGFAFYGGELLNAFKNVAEDAQEFKDDLDIFNKK